MQNNNTQKGENHIQTQVKNALTQ